MKIDLLSMAFGFLLALIFGGVTAILVVRRRHSCKICRSKTDTFYRLHRQSIQPDTPNGIVLCWVYTFRRCRHDFTHVTCRRKEVSMTTEEYNGKPMHESDWSSDLVKELCKHSLVTNPVLTTNAQRLILHLQPGGFRKK